MATADLDAENRKNITTAQTFPSYLLPVTDQSLLVPPL